MVTLASCGVTLARNCSERDCGRTSTEKPSVTPSADRMCSTRRRTRWWSCRRLAPSASHRDGRRSASTMLSLDCLFYVWDPKKGRSTICVKYHFHIYRLTWSQNISSIIIPSFPVHYRLNKYQNRYTFHIYCLTWSQTYFLSARPPDHHAHGQLLILLLLSDDGPHITRQQPPDSASRAGAKSAKVLNAAAASAEV